MSILGDIVGIFDGGGGSSSASVSSTVNLNVNGLNDMKQTLTLAGGTKTIQDITLHPVTVTEKVTVGLTEDITVHPLTLNENISLSPLTLNESIDVKPLAIDTCQTLRLAPFPETQVCQPYRHHVGYTLFGLEFMGVSYDGESKQLLESPRRPQVVERIGHSEHRNRTVPVEVSGARGIRVRVLDPDDE